MATVILQPKAGAAQRPSFATLARQLKALGDPTRLALVALLARRGWRSSRCWPGASTASATS